MHRRRSALCPDPILANSAQTGHTGFDRTRERERRASMTETLNRRLRERLVRGAGVLLPGAANALAARVIAASGFEAVYITGARIANAALGVPDLGLVTLTELVDHVTAVTAAVALPLVPAPDPRFRR